MRQSRDSLASASVERATLPRKPMWYSLPPTARRQVFDVAQTLAIGELGEGHRQILIPAGEVLRVAVSTIAGHAFLKLLVGKMLDQLGKHGAARVHPALSLLPRGLPSTLLTPFVFQIVLTPKRMHQTESTILARSLRKFLRTAVWPTIKRANNVGNAASS